jgi:hypothetical protein
MRPVGVLASVCLASAVCVSPAGAEAGTPAAAAPAIAAPAAGNPTPAVWREQHVEFFYMGRTSRYSCDGLRDKVRAMLLDLGVRRDLKVEPLGCADYDRVPVNTESPRLKIVFSSPALPDAAAKPLREGDMAATDARFEEFTITSDAFRNMGIGDCELVQEFARQILPKLVVRDVKQDILCVPYQPSGSRFFVRGEILKTLPRAERLGGGQSADGLNRPFD